MSGLDEKAVLAACEAYHADLPTHDPPSRWAMEQAISAYLAAATPADVGEEPVAWTNRANLRVLKEPEPLIYACMNRTNTAEWNVPLYSATALERVVRERDEANELKAHARKCCDDADAKLAEARKVIEPFARAADNAERLAGHDGPLGQCVELEHLRAARRFIEETK